MTLRFPDLFVIDAPKCGTTSVAEWLSGHPSVFMCDPKEPSFFSTDIKSGNVPRDEAAYRALFSGSGDRHLVVGEASTTYLRSTVAVDEILARAPDARFVVCLRDPVEMAQSVHGQLVAGGRETETDFAQAWRLQPVRKAGKSVPATVGEPADLQYGEMCRTGAQVDRLLEKVARSRVHVMFLEDMAADPRGQWLRLQAFLGVAEDGRTEFRPENTRRHVRAPRLVQMAQRAVALRDRLGIPSGLGIGRLVSAVATRPAGKPAGIDAGLRQELRAYFAPDIAVLRARLDGPFPDWVEGDA